MRGPKTLGTHDFAAVVRQAHAQHKPLVLFSADDLDNPNLLGALPKLSEAARCEALASKWQIERVVMLPNEDLEQWGKLLVWLREQFAAEPDYMLALAKLPTSMRASCLVGVFTKLRKPEEDSD